MRLLVQLLPVRAGRGALRIPEEVVPETPWSPEKRQKNDDLQSVGDVEREGAFDAGGILLYRFCLSKGRRVSIVG